MENETMASSMDDGNAAMNETMESSMDDGNADANDDADANGDDANDATTFLDALCPAERHYIEKGYKKQILYVMCIGMKDSTGAPLIDLAVAPWSRLKKTEVKPSLKDLVDEIGRRSPINSIPRCSNWRAKKCNEWLTNNPILHEDDISFLVTESNRFKATIVDAVTEQQNGPSVNGTSGTSGGSWRGSVPYLRLILCLLENDIKEKYLRRGDTMSRQELDGRNSEQRDPTVYEMIADRWNSSDFNPTLSVSTVHEDYRTPVDCSHQEVCNLQPATSSKVQNSLSSMRADLIRIIQNWERSGQGDSGMLPSDDDSSSLDELEVLQLHLGNSPIDLLLRWTLVRIF
jgi:hypothetical protein